MPMIQRLIDLTPAMTAWRRDLHAHPETAFEEARTADLIAEQLASFGIGIHRGLARTGVVGQISAGTSDRAIGLRADMDALHVTEQNQFAHRSRYEGRMHACGHDGHSAMLLGAARYLAETRNFDGTVCFIFQPAEEHAGGARRMVEEGLFERFPVDAVFGLHNWPGLPVGQFAVMQGPMMAGSDTFEITVTGRGAHAAMPHHGIDPIVIGAMLVQALQTITSRSLDPADTAVLTVTQFHGGDAWNVIPPAATLRGTVRWFEEGVRDAIEQRMRELAAGLGAAYDARISVHYDRGYPPTINTAAEAGTAAAAMAAVVGVDSVLTGLPPSMAAEDFADMLRVRPGAYGWIGNGTGADSHGLHNPHYDFNDAILPIGASYWARLVERVLAPG